MNKGLKALARIYIHSYTGCERDFEIVETELKRLEEIDKVMFFNNQKMAKQDEILRIIKEKMVDIAWLLKSENCSKYNLGVGSNQALKKPQYDLLKEVLL